MKNRFTAIALLLGCATGFAAGADDALPKTHFNIVGHASPQPQSTIERAFWHDTIPQASKGAVTAKVTPIDQAGMDDKAMLRMLRMGIMDGAGFDVSKMSSDDPRFEGCDLAGLAQSPDQARQVCEAYRDVLERQMREKWNTKLLAIGANPAQVLWCRDVVASLADLKGKKVRVFSHAMRDVLQGVGAAGVNMAFAEVVPALSSGVIDCAVTGSLTGNAAGWPEVAKSVFVLPMGWAISIEALSLPVWNKLPASVQAFLTEQAKAYEDTNWEAVRLGTLEAENCNTGKQPCTLGKLANVQVNHPTEADAALYRKLVDERVVSGWKKRCGPPCAQEWDATVGKALADLEGAGS